VRKSGAGHRQLTNAAGAITDTYTFDAFGNKIASTGTTPNSYFYRGEQYDPDLGLYYLRARYYNPITGRFMSRDPEESTFDPQELNKYLYANGDPVNLADPTGRASTSTLVPPQTQKAAGGSISEYVGLTSIALGVSAAVDLVGQTLNCDYTFEGSVVEAAAESLGFPGFQIWRDTRCSAKPKRKTCREENPTWPVFYVSFAATPEIARNDWYAIHVDGKRDDLHYDADLQRRAQRRDLACPAGKYHGTRGEQCDEYPFASTWEGGAGATTKLVPRSENSAQGGYLKGVLQQAFRRTRLLRGGRTMTETVAETWNAILSRLNSILLRTERWRVEISGDVLSSGWCGQPPATDAEIRLGEERLGVSLPPSYREFLKLSNGWRPFSSFVERIYPLEEVERLRIANPDYLAEIQKYYQEDEIADLEYLDFDNLNRKQALRHRYYPDSLVLGTGWQGSSELILLNPQIVSADGEWEAIFFANWLPGNVRFRSFLNLVEDSVNSLEKIEASRSLEGKS
jgi:RHS repeat-associated protein